MEYQGYKKNAKKCQINYGNICESKCCKYKKIHYITEPIFLKDTKKDTKDTIKILIKGTNYHWEKFKILKSRIAFEKWTFLKMSKMKNLEIVLKITFQFYDCDENALNFLKII